MWYAVIINSWLISVRERNLKELKKLKLDEMEPASWISKEKFGNVVFAKQISANKSAVLAEKVKSSQVSSYDLFVNKISESKW